jgi:hypothetical protein
MFACLLDRGYIVVAPRACDDGCECKKKCSLPGDPDGFQTFYTMQLRAITWARSLAGKAGKKYDAFREMNTTCANGIAGHSMGGQATVFSSSGSNATAHDIKAAVMHHAYTHVFPAPNIPFLAFTGTKDTTAPPAMADGFFGAASSKSPQLPRGLVNRVGATHHEPDITDYNPLLPQFTAAWFKIYLDEKPQDLGIDWIDLIYGNGTGTLCGGGAGEMANCSIVR